MTESGRRPPETLNCDDGCAPVASHGCLKESASPHGLAISASRRRAQNRNGRHFLAATTCWRTRSASSAGVSRTTAVFVRWEMSL